MRKSRSGGGLCLQTYLAAEERTPPKQRKQDKAGSTGSKQAGIANKRCLWINRRDLNQKKIINVRLLMRAYLQSAADIFKKLNFTI